MDNRIALNPQNSVVVEACAGSGKTWLLVSRIVRLLLDGVPPGEILAITFTRKAAQEMQARLHEWLHLLAVQDDDVVREFCASALLMRLTMSCWPKRAACTATHCWRSRPSPSALSTAGSCRSSSVRR